MHYMIKAMIANWLDKLNWEKLSVKEKVPEGDCLNYAVKVTVKWTEIEICVQKFSTQISLLATCLDRD